MRFLLVEKIQNQQHIRASFRSLKSAENVAKVTGWIVVPFSTKKEVNKVH